MFQVLQIVAELRYSALWPQYFNQLSSVAYKPPTHKPVHHSNTDSETQTIQTTEETFWNFSGFSLVNKVWIEFSLKLEFSFVLWFSGLLIQRYKGFLSLQCKKLLCSAAADRYGWWIRRPGFLLRKRKSREACRWCAKEEAELISWSMDS